MEAEGTLEVIAEISIAFTGFAGIFGALAGGRLRPDQPHVWLPFWGMIEVGMGTLFAALFPLLPYHLGLPDQQVWSASSGLLVILIACHLNAQYHDAYNGRSDLSAAAWNAGPGAVDRYGKKVPNYAETKGMVKRLMGYMSYFESLDATASAD